MARVELSLIMELYKQINKLQYENIRLKDENMQLTCYNCLLKDENLQITDDIYELEAENRLLKTELLSSLRKSLDI
jgi:hypothetical protein